MGQSTDAILVYGIDLGYEEDSCDKLPWNSEQFGEEADGMEGRLLTWWRKTRGFVNPHEHPFDDEGSWKRKYLKNPNSSAWDARTDTNELGELAWKAWNGAIVQWDKENPLPIELVSHCSSECPMWIVAVPGTKRIAYRGSPEMLGGDELSMNVRLDASRHAGEFVNRHIPDVTSGFQWILCSDWS